VPDTRYRGEYAEAYVRALALAAGLNVATFAVDDGIDAQIRYTSEDDHPVLRNWPGVDLQVKSWSTPAGQHDFWSFSGLNEQQYNKLVGKFTFPRYLVVLIVPTDRWLLTEVRDDGLLLRHCAYYTTVPGPRVAHPDPSRRKGVRVPKRNVLTAQSLRHLVSPQLIAQRSAP
jgi:hypothetical protein